MHITSNLRSVNFEFFSRIGLSAAIANKHEGCMGMTLKASASQLSEKISTFQLALECDYGALCSDRTAETFKFSHGENLDMAIMAQYREIDEPEMDESMT